MAILWLCSAASLNSVFLHWNCKRSSAKQIGCSVKPELHASHLRKFEKSEERELVVVSGTSKHMLSKRDSSAAGLGAVRVARRVVERVLWPC